jgi:hypothetical protein
LRIDAADPAVEGLDYLGIYLRMDKNQVRAFEGPELDERMWRRLFAHYFNLLAAREFCALLTWVTDVRPDLESLPATKYQGLGRVLALGGSPTDAESLARAIDEAMCSLELFINNPRKSEPPTLSISERPVVEFSSAIATLSWSADKPVFCCIDEYENLLNVGQSILNTYIKHSSAPLSYKIGVRSNGLHSRSTIDESDQLQTPDDYIEIDIPQEGFDTFAEQVADRRLGLASGSGTEIPGTLNAFLEDLSPDAEAELLGVERVAEGVLAELRSEATMHAFVSAQPPLRIALLRYWSDAHPKEGLQRLASDWASRPTEWNVRYGSYQFNLLVWLSKGRKGARTKKYYCGGRALIAMAGGNIRYFMELLDRSIAEEIAAHSPKPLPHPFVLSAKSQTRAAQRVGQNRLQQLEGVSGSGVRLKRLVLGIGRVFFERSRMEGTAPEQTRFTLSGDATSVNEVVALLEDGVGHLAFEASPRTMRTSIGEPRDNEYRLHPIFSAFFDISYRKKRRVTFDARDLLEVIVNPSVGIAKLLDAPLGDVEDLPEQMALFVPFFGNVGTVTKAEHG